MPPTTASAVVSSLSAIFLGGLLALAGVALSSPAASEESAIRPRPQQEPPSRREQFAKQLHTFAKKQSGSDRRQYFALVRRGMDRFDELAARAGDASKVQLSEIDLRKLDATPADADTAPNAQFLTTLRVGLKFEDDQKIVEGFPLASGQYEEVVALTGNGFLCSGIALDGRHVLTAAHCACDLGLVSGQNTDPLAVIKIGLKTDGQEVRQRFDINTDMTQVFPNNAGMNCANMEAQVTSGRLDLAVVEIKGGGSMQVPPIRIQKPEVFERSVPRTKEDGPAFFIFGFGCTLPEQVNGRFLGCRGQNSGTKGGGIIFYSLNCAPASAGGFSTDPELGDPLAICAPELKEFILSNYFKQQRTTDTCAGDSGGPVMQRAPGDSSAIPYRLVGITSRSLHRLGHCGFGGIYTKVADPKVIEWLKGLRIDVQE
jgi:Trypsin